ncbi:MAG TPA: hypothetical protein VJK52_01820 [Candidatus Nanoarchaeia archaeon]|nr:hypothetical protein [Candidatus Nanoarchaeia archaeon]
MVSAQNFQTVLSGLSAVILSVPLGLRDYAQDLGAYAAATERRNTYVLARIIHGDHTPHDLAEVPLFPKLRDAIGRRYDLLKSN